MKVWCQILIFSHSLVISKSMHSFWMISTTVLSNRWCRYELIGCWNKWLDLCSKTGLWWQECLQETQSAGISWAETDQFTSTFHATVFSHCESLVQTGLNRVTTNKIKRRQRRVQQSCFLRSFMLYLSCFPSVTYPALCLKKLLTDPQFAHLCPFHATK